MIRRPLRPLARILQARDQGVDPDRIEAQERAARLAACQKAERRKAERRLVLLGGAFVLGFGLVAAQMARVSASEPEPERSAGLANPILSDRADIVDRNGRVLATNVATTSLYAHPKSMVDPRAAADGLARIFPDLDAEELFEDFTGSQKFLWIERSISPEQHQLVHDLGEPGLLFGRRQSRLYPNGRILAHTLGGARYGREGVHSAEVLGRAGIELGLNSRLTDPKKTDEPLVLSIDLAAQTAMEEVLAEGMETMNAKGAVGILMEADTGQIRAMASLPDFDPNNRPTGLFEGDPSDNPLFNRALQGRYELGSTFKPFTVALALETGLVAPQTMVDSKSPMKWGRYRIRDFKDYGPQLSVEDIIVKSSNVGTARIAIEQGGAAQRRFLENLGLMTPLRVELAESSSSAPILPRTWSELTTMTVSYGHGISVTPLHLAAAYATIANGGYRVEPSFIENPNIDKTDNPQVISERTSRQVRDIMRQVMVRGTAREADVEGYALAGKTGTADKPLPGGGYARDKVISTLASVFPAANPKYVLIVALDEPTTIINKTSFRTAGLTAAPVAADIVRRLAPILGMRPGDFGTEGPEVLYTLAGNN
ncbi:peptidoglycan D,D-transpeptidase FtsI family protein [Amaricoccus tamworthensis]|uniref:peptidoglycan D,D-transpeptidase FtsI family protein n=1 Tax=Amaricoccus tamworthensis TaxID=57002 RepID=UPI003C7A8EEC